MHGYPELQNAEVLIFGGPLRFFHKNRGKFMQYAIELYFDMIMENAVVSEDVYTVDFA